MKRYGGINRFYFDSDFTYNDPSVDYSNTTLIPRNIAFVEHYSWISDDPRTKIKIAYQNRRYCGPSGDFPENLRCSYKWDTEKDKLDFNPDFWNFDWRKQVPMLREMAGDNYSFEFELDFDRQQNVINIYSYTASGDYEFTIDDNHGNIVYSTVMSLFPSVNYWISPSPFRIFNKEEGLKFLEINVKKEGEKIHSERLHFWT